MGCAVRRNARAPFFLAQAAAPHLRATHGAIVNMADIYAERPLRAHALYGMSKAALVHMTRALALELGARRARQRHRARRDPLARRRQGRCGESRRCSIARRCIAPARRKKSPKPVRWLLREATYTTGQVLRLDGGRLLET